MWTVRSDWDREDRIGSLVAVVVVSAAELVLAVVVVVVAAEPAVAAVGSAVVVEETAFCYAAGWPLQVSFPTDSYWVSDFLE